MPFQKAVFYRLKGGLSSPQIRPLAGLFAVFRKAMVYIAANGQCFCVHKLKMFNGMNVCWRKPVYLQMFP